MTDWPFDKADNPTANKLAKIVVSESQHPIVKFEIKTSKQKKIFLINFMHEGAC